MNNELIEISRYRFDCANEGETGTYRGLIWIIKSYLKSIKRY
jgi:hypothetical protein